MFKAIVCFIVAVLFIAFAFPANAAESVCDSPEWWGKYEGTRWTGAWSVVNGAGQLEVSLSCLNAPYHGALTLVNERKVEQKASVVITISGKEVVIATRGDVLVLTLSFGTNSEGQTTLNGSYTSGGQPWGNVWLAKKAEPTKYVAVTSAAALAGLVFEGEWRAYRGDGTFGAGRQTIRFDSGGQPEMATFNPDGQPRGNPWRPRLEIAGDGGVLRLVGGTRVDIFRLRVEGKTLVLLGVTRNVAKNAYTQAIVVRAPATPEQFSQLK